MTKSDQNFNDRKSTFKKNIYGSSKGKVREAILMRDLEQHLKGKKKLRILDVGGGQGQVALKLAKLGHSVLLTDISEEMLMIAKEAAIAESIPNIDFRCLPLQELQSSLTEKYDLVMCHAVFEWLSEPREAFSLLKQLMKADGAISFMFYNHIGQTMSNLVYANFDYIKAGMKAKKVVKLNPQSSLHPTVVDRWLEEENLATESHSGVRVFHDYIRDLSKWETDLAGIIEMELEYSQVEPYRSLGRYQHMILVNK